MYKDSLGFQCRDEADDLRERTAELEKRVTELETALRKSPCTCNSEGTFVCIRCTTLENNQVSQ